MKLTGAILTVISLAALWLLFAPLQMGGQAGYVIVTGDSMEPLLSTGDLVIIRRTSASRTGDVITYQHPELGTVIHRVIGVEGARFIVQGDNNDWIDSHEPVQDEITGKLWFTIPGAGRYLGLVRQPAMFAVLSIVIGLTVMLPGRKKDSAPPRAATGGLPTLMEPRGRDLLGLFALVALGALAVAGLAFSRSSERQTIRETPYEHTGNFSYSAAAPQGIYNASEVVSGEPIFRALIDSFDVRFDYALDSKAPVDGAGVAGLTAVLSSDNGWQRRFELQAPTAFDGQVTTVSGHIDLAEIQAIITRLETETGIVHRQYTLTLQPDIAVGAAIGGEPVQEHFAPTIAFKMDAQQLQLIRTSASDGSILQQGGGGLVSQARLESNTLSLAMFDVPVSRARQFSLGVLGASLIAFVALLVQTFRVRGRSDIENLTALCGPRLVAVRSGASIDTEATVEVAASKDFERLLEHHQGPVFSSDKTFYIDYDGQRYRFGPAQCPPRIDDTERPEPPQVQPVEPVRIKQAPPRRQFAISQILYKHRRGMERA